VSDPTPTPVDDVSLVDLFDASVRTAVSRIDGSVADLLPSERDAVLRAVPRRQREFATARRVARRLLVDLGRPPVAIPRNPDRTPAWPDGLVGSISHCEDLCAVALAERGAIAGLGIDVEPDQPLDAALWPRICTPQELAAIVAVRGATAEQGRAARLVFCAKEAFYKSVYPSIQRVLGFQEVEVRIDWRCHRFETQLAGLPDGARFDGRFAQRGGFSIAAATLWSGSSRTDGAA
jgi:4'-phosphopantetheinyl transferase EntD